VVARTLAAADLYPAALSLRRPSLESVFIELTADHPMPDAPPADPEVAA
jgi:hypothetical protein